jgi:alanine dehydrogenase
MPDFSKNIFGELAKQASLQPQEKLQAIKKDNKQLNIGIPLETTYQEKRIGLSPLSIQSLSNRGHQVIMESNAGEAANFTDIQYSEAGAKIVYDKKSVYDCDIIVKVDPPTEDEIELLKPGQLLFSAVQLGNLKKEYIDKLVKKKITAIAFEFLRDESGGLPIIRAMSEIAGRASVLIAADYLNNSMEGKGELLGGIPGVQPTDIVIIGAGAVGEYATRAALGLGAHVTVFDNNLYKLRRLEHNIGQRIFSSTLLPHVLGRALEKCDVAIGALRSSIGQSPCVVSEEMVLKMRPKSLIIDVSIDQGGCFDTSKVTNHENPTFTEHDVIHYCVPNIASKYARTSSYALSNILTPIMMAIGNSGGFQNRIWEDEGLRKGVYIYKGNLTNRNLASRFGMNCKELDFLIPGNEG